jgi:hypothetical protein
LDGMQVVRAALHAFHRDAKHKQILE